MWPLRLFTLLCCLSRLAAIHGPGSARGYIGGSLTVTCDYGAEYESYKKWWCRGEDWHSCKILVDTTGTEQAVKKDRVTIRDSQRQCRFTMTMKSLRFNDIDTYWCGIERPGVDLGVQVKMSVVPGSAAIRGPGSITGYVGGSLTVTCDYEVGYEKHKKWWCRGADWNSCRILVQSAGTEKEVKKDRVTIRDSQQQRRFTVSMKSLRFDDIDTYWCGIERSGVDLGVQVRVSVVPAPTKKRTTNSTTIITTTKATINEQTMPVNLEVSTSFPNVTHHPIEARSLLRNIHFLLHVFLEVPLLLGMVGLVLWVSRPQRSPRKCPENQ